MKALSISFAALLCAASSFGAQSTNAPYAATIVPDIRSLSTNRTPIPNETVLVPRGRTNPYPSALSFTYRPDISTSQVRWPVRVAAKTNGVYESDQAYAAALDVRFWGVVGDNHTDNYPALTNLLAYAATNMAEICFPPGRYLISKPIRTSSNFPINFRAIGGSFATGWNTTNDVTESSLIYNGAATDVFVDLYPSVGLWYGVNLDRVTIDANGLANTALRIRNGTRGVLNQVRVRNSKYYGLIVDNTVYLNAINFSCSANEVPFITNPAVGLQLTNAANGNTFIGTTISGTTNWAVEIVEGTQPSFANAFIGGGIESNLGGGVHIGPNCSLNSFDDIWFEANADTNRFFVLDNLANLNTLSNLRFENRIGKVYINGAYNKVSSSIFGRLELGSSAGHNRLQDLILDIGQQPYPLMYAWNQIIDNVIDATALLHMNIMPDAWSFYGTNIWMYDTSTNRPYPMATLARDSILWGDGTSAPNLGWARYSASSLSTYGTVLFLRNGVSDGVFTVYAPGDTYPRVSLNTDTTYSTGPGGATPVDTSFSRFAARTWMSSGSWLITRPNTNSSLIGSYIDGAAQPMFYIRADGLINWGAGGTTATDISMYRSAAGRLHVDTDLEIGGGIWLGGVYRSSWPGGTTYTGTNGVSVSGSVISANFAAGANITLSTNGSGVISIASTGSGGATNGTPVSVNAGGTMTAANLQSSTNITVTGSGTNISFVVTNSGVTPGAYSPVTATIGSDGRVISAANSTSSEILSRVTIDKGLTNNAGTLQLRIVPGSNMTFTTNGNDITLASASGSTNSGTPVGVNGAAALSAANLRSSTNITVSVTGTNIDFVVTNSGVTPGAYALLTATIGSDGRVSSATVTPVGKGLTNNAGTLQLRIAAGSNITLSTNGNDITIAATNSGSSNGTPVNVNGGTVLTAANIRSSSNIVVSTTSTNIDIAVTNSGVTAGAYTSANITVGADGRIISAANGSGGGGSGTNVFVNNTLVQPAKLTNTTEVAVGTNANGDIKFTLNTVTNTIAFRNNTNKFTMTNTFSDRVYLESDMIFWESAASPNDLFGFYESGGNLRGWSGSSTNSPLGKNIWFEATRYGAAPQQVGDITITALGTILLNGNTTVQGTFTNNASGARQLTAGTNLIVGGTIQAGGSFGTAGQLLTATGTGVAWSNAPASSSGTIITFHDRSFQPGTNLYGLYNTTNSTPVIVFDPDTEWNIRYRVMVPGNIGSLPSTVSVKSFWRPIIGNSASQSIVVSTKYESVVDSDSFTVANLVTNTVSSQTWIAFTNIIGTSNMTIGSPFILNISAPTTGSATNLYQMQEGISVSWF